MKLLIPLSLILTLFVSSCTSYHQNSWERNIANEIEAPLDAEKLFTIASSSNIGQTDLTHHASNTISSFAGNGYAGGSTAIKFIDDPKMASDEAFRIIPSVENQQLVITIKRSMSAKFDTDATAELIKFMNLTMIGKFTNHYSVFELYYNAVEGDFKSLMSVAKLRNIAATTDGNNTQLYGYNSMPPGTGLSEEKQNYWSKIITQFESQERKYNKLKKVQTNERKAVMDVLDKVSDDQQFRNLVAKNDRKGAAKLLRSYLPWEEMPPFEKQFWETHLKVMADPLPMQKRILIYRGIDDDVVQKAQLAGKVLTEEEAIKDQQIFLMSTMMTKNQGTWNRRLRSLTAMYEKFMGTDAAGSSEFVSTTRITNMFKKHSQEPKGSPFLSYTPSINVARQFGYKKTTAYFLDPRLLYFNYASGYKNEIEFLLPVASFPDDLAAVYSVEVHGQNANYAEVLKNSAVEKLERELGKGKGQAAYNEIIKRSDEYFKPVMQKNGVVAQMPMDGNTVGLLKKVIGKSSKEAAQALDGNQNLHCMDLIQLFWK
jgi:hypothetical protein